MRKMMRRGLCLLLVLMMLIPAQAAFADRYTEYQTEHFTLAIPETWITQEAESKTFTYIVPPEDDAYMGVYLRAFEIPVPEEIDETDSVALVQNLYATIIAQLGTLVYATPIPVGNSDDVACLFLVTAKSPAENPEEAEDIYEAGVIYAKNGNTLLLISQDYLCNNMMYTYMLAYEYIMARVWNTEDGKPQNALMSYADFMDAQVGAKVTIEAVVGSIEEWSEEGVTIHAQDEDGEYCIVLQECTKEEYDTLVPHMKLLVGGEKGLKNEASAVVNAWYDEVPNVKSAVE